MFTKEMPLQTALKLRLVIAEGAEETWWFPATHSLMKSQSGIRGEQPTALVACKLVT